MSDEEPESSDQHLVCPLCLDIFKEPRLLDCGHTFCLHCLQKNGRFLHHQDSIDCPVCREATKLSEGVVEKLPASESVVSAVADFQKNLNEQEIDSQAKACLTHDQPKQIFCIDCSEFICQLCIDPDHGGHSMDDRDIFETSIQQRIADLNSHWNGRKEVMRTRHSQDVQEYFDSMKEQIRAACREKVRILEQNEKALLEEVQSVQENLLPQIMTFTSKDSSEERSGALELATSIRPDRLDGDRLAAHRILCSDLEHHIKHPVSAESSQHINMMTRTVQC